MDADFAPLRRELAEAQERLGALRATVHAYLLTGPIRFDGEIVGKKTLLRCRIAEAPEQAWGEEATAVALAARTVLDALVEQLVIANGQDPAGTGVEFPISTDGTSYAKGNKPQRERLLRGVASRHRAIIDGYQPFQAGPKAMWSAPLARLEQFGEGEALGPVTLGGSEEFTLTLERKPLADITVDFGKGLPLVDGAEVIGLDNQALPDDFTAENAWVFDGFIGDVGYRDGNVFVPLADLEAAVGTVAEIVDRCVAKQ